VQCPGWNELMADDARLVDFAIHRVDDGRPGYRLETPFGQAVQVLPRPPSFRATLTLEWEGGRPDEIAALVERARALGIRIED
jgi:hypothetical protein